MKNNRPLIRFLTIFISFAFCGCPTPDGNQNQTVYTASQNTFDSSGRPVATFLFKQTISTASQTTVDLKITNITSLPLCVTYTVTFDLNYVSWQYQGSVHNLAADSSLDVGTVSTNPARIDLGKIVIQFTSAPTPGC